MRLLLLLQGDEIEGQVGADDAFTKLQAEGYLSHYEAIPYTGYAKRYGWEAFYDKVVSVVEEKGIDVVFFQYYHSPIIADPTECLSRLSLIKEAPLIVTSNGDPFSTNRFDRHYFPKSFRCVAKAADIVFSTSMGISARVMKSWGAKNIVLLPNGLCQSRFPKEEVLSRPEIEKKYDVVFLGSDQQPRHPFHWALKKQSKKRREFVKMLEVSYGEKFGLFGKNWGEKHPNYGAFPFDKQDQVAEQGKVLCGGYPASYARYYNSDRIFFQGIAKVPFVDAYV